MFNVGGGEILVILVIALLVLGPERLPTAGRQIGRALAEFRRVSTGVQADLRDALNADELLDTVGSIRDAVDIRGQIKDELASVTSAFTVGGSAGGATSTESSSRSNEMPTVRPPDGIEADDRPSTSGSGTIVGAPSGTFRDVLLDDAPAGGER